ncbi:MAG: sugar ABC transporter substrate-binding protein [Chthonomonas sp.]|nr:sugar ABC transporter substrate-binding protein [Chthonomonas sp.]
MARGLFPVTLSLTLVALLAGCSKSGEAEPSATATAKPSKISFMIFGDPGEHEAYKNLVKAYETKHSGAKVELIHIPSQGDYRKRLGADFAANTPADVVLINYRRYAQFAAKGVVEPLGPYLEKSSLIKKEDFYGEAIRPFVFKGELYGIPQNLSSLVVYYNKNLFDEAGLPHPKSTWTWDEFVSTAKMLTKDRDGDGKMDVYGLGTEVSLQRLIPFVWQAGGEIVDDAENPTSLNLGDPGFQKALQWFIDLRAVHKVIPDQVEEKSEDSETRFQNGRTAMFLNSRRGVPTYREITGFEWDVVALPVGKQAAGILHADAYFMPKAAKDKAAVWKFIEFANSKEGQEIVAASGRTVPSIRAVAESQAFLDPSQKPANSKVFLETLPTMRAVPVNENWVDLESTATEELERAVYSGLKASEVTKTLKERTDGVLAK